MTTHPLWRPYVAAANARRQSGRVARRQVAPGPLQVVGSDWAVTYDLVRQLIDRALADRVREISHVGSTAVVGLIAKPVLDVDLTVADADDESAYLPALEAVGFRLIFRDPVGGDAHRQLTLAVPNTNLHVWSPDAIEPRRHRMFVSWLVTHDDDRERYAVAKRAAADGAGSERYNDAKSAVVYDIYERAFRADPAHPHDPCPRPARGAERADEPRFVESGSALPGGWVSSAVRVGDRVHRTPGSNAAFVDELLNHLAAAGWTGAPRFHGVDPDGREILDFVPGPTGVDPAVRARAGADASLVGLTRLVRELHDLTAGTALAGDQEVVCHHDLDPRNTVYREHDGPLAPYALIDWDLAAPGRRIQDVAHLAWQFLPLGPAVTDVADTARRLRLIADSYGLERRGELVTTVLWWQERCWRGIAAGAAADDPAMVALRAAGAVDAVRAAHAWTTDHRAVLEAALLS